MSDPILKSLGIKSSDDLSDAAFDVLREHLALFARAGGVVTWDLWRRLGTDTKAALVAAFERVRAENAASIGMASQGPRQAARVLSLSDDGELDCELCLNEYVDKMCRQDLARRRIS